MLENYLVQIGMKCGTVKNFNSVILADIDKDEQSWYFKTPIQTSDDGSGLKTATVKIAYPFIAGPNDTAEDEVIERLSAWMQSYEASIIRILRRRLIVPTFKWAVIPFWSNSQTERTERTNFGNTKVHIISAEFTVKYRSHWL
jgi:hypothetical protein